jgi:hypothetical protein
MVLAVAGGSAHAGSANKNQPAARAPDNHLDFRITYSDKVREAAAERAQGAEEDRAEVRRRGRSSA